MTRSVSAKNPAPKLPSDREIPAFPPSLLSIHPL